MSHVKKISILSVLFALLLLSYACESRKENAVIEIDSDDSYYLDYYIEEDCVVNKCHYCIVNNANTKQSIQLCGFFQDDHNLGLLTETQLLANNIPEKGSANFELAPGKNELDVFYVGTFGGVTEKTNRLLPKTRIIEPDDSDIGDG